MSGSKGAALILAAGVFGLGWLAAPDVRVEEKTNMDIRIVRVPDTHVVTKTKTVTKDLPSVCNKVTKLNREYHDLLDAQVKVLGVGPDLISDARLAIYEKDTPATTEIIERFEKMRTESFDLITKIHAAKTALDFAIGDCEAARK